MMASPMLESFCCMRFGHNHSCTNYSNAYEYDHRSINISYNVLCIMSSILSICGALYMLTPRLPRRPPRGRTELESMLRQNAIICVLAIADLMASFGILVRSSTWLNGNLPMNEVQLENAAAMTARIFCAVSSAWVHFFYICTYFWTLIYAVDMLRLMRKKSCPLMWYHIICWGVAAAISVVGLFLLYYPSLLRCERSMLHLIPSYLSTYIPLCIVMVVNPILYSKATAAVKQWMYSTGTYTERERAVVRGASSRFRSILVVFYVCWTPNLFNGFLMLVGLKTCIPYELRVILWHIMAVLNPLQAFLNSIVYRGVGLCYKRVMLRTTNNDDNAFSRLAEGSSSFTGMNADESSPLLRPLDRSLRVS